MRWIDSIKEAIGLSTQELSRPDGMGHCGRHSVIGSHRRRTHSWRLTRTPFAFVSVKEVGRLSDP